MSEVRDRMPIVDAAKNPDYLRSVADAVTAFREAFAEMLTMYAPTEDWGVGRGMLPAVVTRDGVDPEQLGALRRAVGSAAGLAAQAPALTSMRIAVEGKGVIDPIAAWDTVTKPKPLLEPADVLDACDQMLGRLEGMRLLAEAEAPPLTGVEAMHPTVWGAARPLWVDGHFRAAVAAAGERLAATVKGLTGRVDVSDTSAWQQAFSERPPEPNKPRLRWPGDPADTSVKTMNDGLRQFAPGVQMTVRNPATHGDELTAQQGLERLATLSLLAHWVDACELVEAD